MAYTAAFECERGGRELRGRLHIPIVEVDCEQLTGGCGVRLRPAPAADPPGCVGGDRRWRPRFLLTGSGCKFLYRETKRKAGPQPSPPGPIFLCYGSTKNLVQV